MAAVGSATTAALARLGVQPDLVPREAVGEALAESMIRAGVAGRRVLLLRAEIARGDLVEALKRAGATCDDLAIYRTGSPKGLPEAFVRAFDDGGIDWLTLTSPSSLANLLQLLGRERSEGLRRIRLASIGPVTTRAIRQAGFEAAAEADPHDVEGLVASIVEKSKSQKVETSKRQNVKASKCQKGKTAGGQDVEPSASQNVETPQSKLKIRGGGIRPRRRGPGRRDDDRREGRKNGTP